MTSPATGIVRRRWIGLKTLVFRECHVVIRFGTVTLLPPAISTILYFVIFGEVIGKRVGSQDGINYIDYLAPGLIILWVIPFSYGNTAAGVLGARFFRYIEEILVTPLPYWIVMTGYVTGGVIRGVLVGSIAWVTTILFTHLHIHSIGLSAAVMLLAAFASALGGFITAIFAKTFEQVNMIQNLILAPLTYVGGVFNSISTLPGWAQKLSLANPMFYMVNAFRYGFLGISDVRVEIAFLVVFLLAISLFIATVQLSPRGIGYED